MGKGGGGGLLSVHSFNRSLWRYGWRGLDGGGDGIVGKEGSPLASCSACLCPFVCSHSLSY